MFGRLLLTAVLILCVGPGTRAIGQELSRGQTVYVPVYSRVIYEEPFKEGGQPSTAMFSTMLSIRNVDTTNSIFVRLVLYYATEGKLISEEKSAERNLAPLETESIFISYRDKSGGTGANYIVVWEADTPVDVPIIETVNIHYVGTQMSAFTNRGQPIRGTSKPKP
jgi:uncharacterized protein DUF3124